MDLKTEYEFILPRGYVDAEGNVHREGIMRLANAKDEIVPLNDLRVQRNKAYLIIVLLSRVVTRLGTLAEVNTGIVENLFAGDLRFLEEIEQYLPDHGTILDLGCGFGLFSLYIAARMYQDPKTITARILRQGEQVFGDDWFSVMIDPFHDKCSGYRFQTNPNGLRQEALYQNVTSEQWE